MAKPAREELTLLELFSLFRRGMEDSLYISLADSEEYLAVVLYIVDRNQKET
jgi:hypothetical protein